MNPKPPRGPGFLLQRLVPRREREFLLGDLDERYRGRLAARGRAVAHVWYWIQVARALVSIPRLWRARMSANDRRNPSVQFRTRYWDSAYLYRLRLGYLIGDGSWFRLEDRQDATPQGRCTNAATN